MRNIFLFLSCFVVAVSGQGPVFPPGCELGMCDTDHAVCGAQDVTGSDYSTWQTQREPLEFSDCACDWDFMYSEAAAQCNAACSCEDVSDRLSTAQPPFWDFQNSGFTTNHADEIVFAIQRSQCYDSVQYAFGTGPVLESEWANWEADAATNTETLKSQDCKIDVARTLTWYSDKTDVIKAIHDPNSPLLLTEQFGPNSLARVPLPAEYVSQFEYYNEFIVYDGCLNTREVTTFDISIGGETFEIVRHVDNVLKFKIEFPTRLEICTNVTVEVVEITEVLVNQTVYCTEDGGFQAELTFQTFVTWPYRMNVSDGAFDITMSGEGSDCFSLTLRPIDGTRCEDNSVTEPVCVQTWAIDIIPDGECDDICTINGDYHVSVVLEPQLSLLPEDLNPNFQAARDFSFSVTSADFCSRVIAEAEINQEMDAYHDPAREDDDSVFFVEGRVFLEALYNSPDATIYDVDRLYFTVKNFNTNDKFTLYNNSANTANGNAAIFAFETPNDESGDFNPYYVWPEFNLTDAVFGLAAGDFPVTLELCLAVNLTFFGNENDGSSGDQSGKSTAVPQPPGEITMLLELMEMVDNTKFQITELRRQILILPDGSIADFSKNYEPLGVMDVIENENKVVENEPLSPFSIFTFMLAASIFVGLALYALYVLTNRRKYSKIDTKVDNPTPPPDATTHVDVL